MKRSLKIFTLLVGITLLVVPVAWPQTQPGKKITIKLSHGYPIGYIRHQSAVKFKELLEKETNGRVAVEIYPSGQLYKIAEEGEALAMNHVQMIACAGGTPAKFVGEWNVFFMPTVFYCTPTDIKHLLEFENSEVCRKYITSKLEAKGVHFVGFFPSCTSGELSTVKRPVRKIEDFKGLKIHNVFGRAYYMLYELLGGSNQAIPGPDRVMAMSTGMVDGEQGNVDNIVGWGYPIKYVHEWGEIMGGHGGASMLMNLAFWNSLPSDIKKIITEKVVPEAKAWTVTEMFKVEAKAREKLKSQGVEFVQLSPELKEQVVAKTAKPIRDWFLKQYPESGPPILAEAARLHPLKK